MSTKAVSKRVHRSVLCCLTALTLSLGLVGCGNKGAVQKVEIPKVTMTIQVENGLDVDITSVAVYSDVRVDPDQQIKYPENLGVNGVLGDGARVKPHSVVELKVRVDDPEYLAKVPASSSTSTSTEGDTSTENNNNGESEGALDASKVQKFVISVTDINGNVFDYKGIELSDNSIYVIKDKGIEVKENGVANNFIDTLKREADEAKNVANTRKAELDKASEDAEVAKQDAYYKKDKNGEIVMENDEPVKIEEDKLDATKVEAYETAKAAHESAVVAYDEAKAVAEKAQSKYDIAVQGLEADESLDSIKSKVEAEA